MKKYIFQTNFLILFLAYLLVSCDSTSNSNTKNDDDKPIGSKTVDITFYNESRYNLKIHRDSFDGPVLLELPANSLE